MAETQEEEKNYLDPKVLNKIGNLELRARLVMEGFISGMHKSPFRGFSVEFAQHREYVAGDDIRFIDWKIFGKSDRFYIKEFEEETNLRAHLFLDQSESMSYAHEGGMSKYDYAATSAASLAYMIQQQSDSVGLSLFNEGVVESVPPSNTRANLGNILSRIGKAKPEQKTKIGAVLQELSSKLPRRGMVMIMSDLFDDPDEILLGLNSLAQRGHDVVMFHVLDRDEVEFPFERMTMFEGLEGYEDLLVDPRGLRDAYLKEINEFQETIRKGCMKNRVDYVKVVNSQGLDVVLSSYLAARNAQAKRRK